jgi:hypothetical protein
MSLNEIYFFIKGVCHNFVCVRIFSLVTIIPMFINSVFLANCELLSSWFQVLYAYFEESEILFSFFERKKTYIEISKYRNT